MGQCRDLKGSAVRSVVLGIKLVGASASSRDEIANKVMADKKVRKAIHEVFRKEAGKITEARLTGGALDGAAARKFLQPVQKVATPLALNQMKKRPEYAEARSGMNNLKCAFNATPVGVFVDEQKTWLIIAGVVMGAAGAVAMYKVKSGDIPAAGLAILTNNLADKIEVGDVTFGVKSVTLEPSSSSGKGKLTIDMGNLKTVKLKQSLEISTAVKAGSLTELMASDTVVVQLAPSVLLKAKAAAGARDNKPAYDMAVTLKYKPSAGMTMGISAYSKGSGASLTHGAKFTAGIQVDTSRQLGAKSLTTLGATGKIESSKANSGSAYETTGLLTVGLTTTFN